VVVDKNSEVALGVLEGGSTRMFLCHSHRFLLYEDQLADLLHSFNVSIEGI